jgi:hypothetical protein
MHAITLFGSASMASVCTLHIPLFERECTPFSAIDRCRIDRDPAPYS